MSNPSILQVTRHVDTDLRAHDVRLVSDTQSVRLGPDKKNEIQDKEKTLFDVLVHAILSKNLTFPSRSIDLQGKKCVTHSSVAHS